MNYETKQLSISGREVIFLLDELSYNDELISTDSHSVAVEPLGRDLILLLGGLFLEGYSMAKEGYDAVFQIAVTEEQTWLLRDLVTSQSVSVDKKPIGLPLMARFITLLKQFNSEMADLETTEVDEPSAADAADRIAAWVKSQGGPVDDLIDDYSSRTYREP